MRWLYVNIYAEALLSRCVLHFTWFAMPAATELYESQIFSESTSLLSSSSGGKITTDRHSRCISIVTVGHVLELDVARPWTFPSSPFIHSRAAHCEQMLKCHATRPTHSLYPPRQNLLITKGIQSLDRTLANDDDRAVSWRAPLWWLNLEGAAATSGWQQKLLWANNNAVDAETERERCNASGL